MVQGQPEDRRRSEVQDQVHRIGKGRIRGRSRNFGELTLTNHFILIGAKLTISQSRFLPTKLKISPKPEVSSTSIPMRFCLVQ